MKEDYDTIEIQSDEEMQESSAPVNELQTKIQEPQSKGHVSERCNQNVSKVLFFQCHDILAIVW